MYKIKFLFSFIFVLIFALTLLVTNSYAAENKQVVIVNPIRGSDFWEYSHNLLDTPKKQYEVISRNNLPASWLIRYDALTSKEITDFLKTFNSQQDIGIFLEITPTLTKAANVKYNESPNWHYAKSILVTGYSIEDRKKIIDTAVTKYKEVFNKNPKSIGAWWIDAESLKYLKEKYGIEANLDVADQFSTDQYQVWGQYWSTPFYPSNVNALMPAKSLERKIGVVTMQWATRDPFNAFGNGVYDSTYSVQPNDYMLHDLDISYFEKLVDIYPQTTIGLENDFKWEEFGAEYQKQIELVTRKQRDGELKVESMQSFASYYIKTYPKLSPDVLIVADDPLGSEGKVVWYQTPSYRVGWFYNNIGSVIRDLRILNDSTQEVCLKKACDELKLAFNFSEAIDDVNYSTKWIIDQGNISNISVNKTPNGAKIVYNNQAGTRREIEFLPNDIKVDDRVKTLATAILDTIAVAQDSNGYKIGSEINPQINFSENFPQIIIGFLKFILFSILFFVLPGYIFIKRFIYALPVGWSLFTLTSYVLGYLKFDLLIWVLPILGAIFLIKSKYRFESLDFKKSYLLPGLLILLGSAYWLITVVKSGLLYNFGYGYWGPNGHDGIWHLSLISELQRNIPPDNPVFAGERLANYHYFFNLLVAQTGKLFAIDNQDLLFRFFPLCFALLIGVLTFVTTSKIAEKLKLSQITIYFSGVFATVFVYFGGSLGWILTYLNNKTFGGESAFWAQQGRSTLLNPPYAISLIFLLVGINLFWKLMQSDKLIRIKDFINQNNLKLLAGILLTWGTVIEYKAYGGVLIIGALSLLALERAILKKDFRYLILVLAVGILSGAVFIPNNLGSNSLIIFSPFWLVYSMVIFPDRLNWMRLSLAIQSDSIFKIVASYLIGVVIFIIGNLGIRIFGLLNIKFLIRERLLLYIALLGFIFSMLFIQKGTNWNIVQFFYYTILVFNLFAGIALANIFTKGIISKIIVVALLLITLIPANYITFAEYLPLRAPSRVPLGEVRALEFLKNQPEGRVMALNYDKSIQNKFATPIPLYAYESTGYVAAFSNKPVFLQDTVNLEILGVNYKGRLNEQMDVVKFPNRSSEIFKRNNISYLYNVRAYGFNVDESKMGVQKIFENEDVQIYKVNNQ